MALCSVCKKNTAVVFVNKIIDGKPNLEGLCLACAKKKGINPLASMMKQYGASDEDIENMNLLYAPCHELSMGMSNDYLIAAKSMNLPERKARDIIAEVRPSLRGVVFNLENNSISLVTTL